MVGQFFAGIAASRIHARSRLVDNDVGNIKLLQSTGDQFGHQGLSLASGRAVANGHDRAGMRREHLNNLLRGGSPLLRFTDDVEHCMLQRTTTFVDHHCLTATLEARVECQHAAASDRGLQQQIAEVARKHLDGMRLTIIGHFSAEFAFEARQHESSERIANAALEKIGVGMAYRYQHLFGSSLYFFRWPVDPHFEEFRPLATVDR